MNHKAIYRAHPEVVKIDESLGAFDKDGNLVNLNEDLINAKVIEVDEELHQSQLAAKAKKEAALAKLEALGLDITDLEALGLAQSL